jgi:protein subunit release factor B
MAAFPSDPDRESRLAHRMAALGIRESDFQETFVRSGGHGGQNVNKTSTCVLLLHRPSGIQVKCQTSRHQGLNRTLARERLLDRMESIRRSRADAERARVERLRRQKRPRPRRLKERILADKARRSSRKALRRGVGMD